MAFMIVCGVSRDFLCHASRRTTWSMTISSTFVIPSSSTISSASPARKVLPLPSTLSPESSSSATSTSMGDETVATPSTSPFTSPLMSISTTNSSGTTQTETMSSATFVSSTQSLASTTSQEEFVNSSSAPVTSAQGSGEPSVHVVHSITVVTATSTSIITQFPESTFVSPVAVTTLQDGTTFVGTPALVTLLSTSTNSDGSSVTWTHVYANPPTVAAVRTKSFLHNTGAMAGVFALVGVIAAFFPLGMVYLTRRLHRTRRRDKMLVRLRSSAPEHDPDYRHPFNDNGAEPAMHSLSYGITVGISGSARPAQDASPSYKVAFFDVHGHSTSTDQLRPVQQMNTSGTDLAQMTPQSTPSIYPATLPLNENEDEVAIDQQPVEQSKIFLQTEADGLGDRPTEWNTVTSPVVLRERPRTTYTPPPRPPRSVLRTGSVRIDSQWVKSWGSTSTGSGSQPTT